MAKEVVLNIKLDATEAIQKIKELAVNTGELKDRKKALNEAIKVEELMYKSLAALQAKGIDVGKDLASREEKLLRVRTQNREEIALIDTALKGNSAQTRELTNDVAGLTESGLRFRDKMAQAFSQAIGPTFAKLSDSVSHANLEMGKALKTFGAGSAEFLKAAGNAKKMEEAVDAVKQAQIEATAALKKFGENSDEFKKVNDNLRSLEDTAKQVGEEIGTKLEGGFTRLNVQIRAANKAAQEAAEKYGLASKEFKEAANRVDDLDDQLKRVNATVGSIDLDGKIETAGRSLQGLVGAFQVGESAAALMGVEAEDLNNTMLKVGAALALQDGIKGMIEGAKAAKALALSVGLVTPAAEGGTLAVNGLKLALVSSGIGAIVLLLGLFASHMAEVARNTEAATKNYEDWKTSIRDKAGLTALRDQNDVIKARIALNAELLKGAKADAATVKALQEDLAEAEAKADKNRIGSFEEERDAFRDLQAAKRKVFDEQQNYIAKSEEDRLDLINRLGLEETATNAEVLEKYKKLKLEFRKTEAEADKESLEKNIAGQDEGLKKLSALQDRARKDKEDADKEADKKKERALQEQAEILKQSEQNRIEQFQHNEESIQKLLEETTELALTDEQRRTNAVRDRFFTEITLLEEKLKAEKEAAEEARRAAEALASQTDAGTTGPAVSGQSDEAIAAQALADQKVAIAAQTAADLLALNTALQEGLAEVNEKTVLSEQDKADRIKKINEDLISAKQSMDDAVFTFYDSLADVGNLFAKQNSATAKLLFGIQQSVAIGEIVVNAQRQLAAIAASTDAQTVAAGLLGPAAPAAIAAIKATGALRATSAKINAGIAIATVAAQTVKGFDKGGYTGPGGKYEIAGLVHRDEYVLPKEVVKAIGVPMLDALRGHYTGAPVVQGSYANGGFAVPRMTPDQQQSIEQTAVLQTLDLQPVLVYEELRKVAMRVGIREDRSTL